MSREIIFALVAIASGIFSIVGSVKDLDVFFTNRRAKLFVKILGRKGARVFYGLLGIVLIGIGVFLFLEG